MGCLQGQSMSNVKRFIADNLILAWIIPSSIALISIVWRISSQMELITYQHSVLLQVTSNHEERIRKIEDFEILHRHKIQPSKLPPFSPGDEHKITNDMIINNKYSDRRNHYTRPILL